LSLVLTGGLGQDSFVFSTAPSLSNIDTVTDFNVAYDTVQLAHTIFTTLSVDVLTADQFKILGNGGGGADRHSRQRAGDDCGGFYGGLAQLCRKLSNLGDNPPIFVARL